MEDLPSNDHTQIETKNRLHAEAEAATAKVKALADCLIAFELRGLDGDAYEEQRTVRRGRTPNWRCANRCRNFKLMPASNCADAAHSIGRWNFLKFSLAVGSMHSLAIRRSWVGQRLASAQH